jgi:hypothetical protein
VQSSAERERAFAAALLDPGRPVPPGLTGPDGEPSPKRFSVYRNNVMVGLIDALAANFPAVCRIGGEAFFRAMARAFVTGRPPSSPILLDYGAAFPDFIASFEPAAPLSYLADVARIERAWIEAYHSREAEPLSPAAFAGVPVEHVSDLRLELHPSLRIVRSMLPALTIWRMNIGDGVPGPVDLDAGGEDALVLRPAAVVEVRAMPPGGAELVAALAGGGSLGAATKSAIRASPAFDLATHLAALIGAGAFTGYRLRQEARRAMMVAAVEP